MSQPTREGSSYLSQNSLETSLLRGIAWTGAAKWVTQILGWLVTLIVARLLTPADYGLIAMAELFLGFIVVINEFGLGLTVVTLRSLTGGQIAQINALAASIGAASLFLTCAAAAPLGEFFGAPDLPWVVVVMSATLALKGLQTVPNALLEKELRFRSLALIEAAHSFATALGTIIPALLGLRYWALVAGGMLGSLTSTSLVLTWRAHGFARPSLRSIRPALSFSKDIFVARLSWYAYSNADFLVAGRILGQTALGNYTLAWTLASVPIEKVTALVTRVTGPFFAAVQTDVVALRRYLLTLTEGLAFITFPLTLGLALTANDFILLVLGEHWAGAIQPLTLLALYGSFRSIIAMLPQLLNAIGESRFNMHINGLAAIAMPVGFYYASRWGTVGIATAWIAIHPLFILLLYHRTFRRLNVSVGQYARSLWPALSGCAVMGLGVLTLQLTLPSDLWPPLRLGLEILGGAVLYSLTAVTLHRHRLSAFCRTIRSA